MTKYTQKELIETLYGESYLRDFEVSVEQIVVSKEGVIKSALINFYSPNYETTDYISIRGTSRLNLIKGNKQLFLDDNKELSLYVDCEEKITIPLHIQNINHYGTLGTIPFDKWIKDYKTIENTLAMKHNQYDDVIKGDITIDYLVLNPNKEIIGLNYIRYFHNIPVSNFISSGMVLAYTYGLQRTDEKSWDKNWNTEVPFCCFDMNMNIVFDNDMSHIYSNEKINFGLVSPK